MSNLFMPLILELIEDNPQGARHLLESCEQGQLLTLVNDIKSEYAALIIECMLPYSAARLSKHLSPERYAQILKHINTHKQVRILSQVPISQRNLILDALPIKIRARCLFSLAFAPTQVGAWIKTNLVVCMESSSLSQVLTACRQQDHDTLTDAIFIVDNQQRIKGRVYYMDIIHADLSQPLNALMFPEVHVINAHTNIDEALKHPAWNWHNSLPVVNRQKQFIGLLQHNELYQAYSEERIELPTKQQAKPPVSLFAVYAQTLMSLVGAVYTKPQNRL